MGEYPSYGGVEKVSTVLANQFIADGYEVTIASFRRPYPEFAEMFLSKKCNLLALFYPVLSYKNIHILRKYIKQHHIEILINQWVVPFFTTLVWKLAIKGTGCRVYSVHHNKPDTNKKLQDLDVKINQGRFYLKPLRWLVEEISRQSLAFCIYCSDKYILLSPAFIPIAKIYSRIADNRKYDALPNPITITLPHDNVFDKQREILCVGRIEYNQKRSFRIVDVWEELEQKFPEWHLSFVGDGPDRADLERRIRKADLKHITITGFVDPLEFYRKGCILLMTSEYEGFPLVIVEGMTYGVVPIVYDSFEAVHDIIENGVNGYITPKPYDTQNFVSILSDLMHDGDKLKLLAKQARFTAHCFSIERVTNQWYNKYL